jgi:predicted ferric reductase
MSEAKPRRRLLLSGAFWIAVYLALAMAPLVVLLLTPAPPGRTFWRDFSSGLGFAGLAMMGLQFLLTARFRRASAPFGIDILYHFHRQISLVGFVLILAHPVILFIENPALMPQLLNPIVAPWRARFAVLSVLALIAIIVISLYRKRLGIQYETWRLWHGALAVAALGFALAHVVGVGYYVNTPWKQALWIGITGTVFLALAYVRVAKPIMMLRRPYVVDEVIEERADSWTLVLHPEGHPGMKYRPGQFAWLTLGNSPFAVKEHPFSFSSSAERRLPLTFTIKELGDFTAGIKHVKPGTRVYLDGPYGQFSIDRHPGVGYVFIAGGVGITPIMSMIRTLADRQDPHPVLLVYANKTWDAITFREELEELKGRMDLEVVHVLEQPPEGWEGPTGYVTKDLLEKHLPADRERPQYFVCGPDPMMDAVEGALAELHVPLLRVHSERYNLV